MRRSSIALAGALALALAPVPALHAQDPGRIQLDTFSLPNGLEVILAPDHATQVVAVNVWYDVGSRNEVPGRTGFAHLFEHMMFQGSANVKKGEHLSFVERATCSNFTGSMPETWTRVFSSILLIANPTSSGMSVTSAVVSIF